MEKRVDDGKNPRALAAPTSLTHHTHPKKNTHTRKNTQNQTKIKVICDRSRTPDSCVIGRDAIAEVIAQTHAANTVQCRHLDTAVSADKSVAFTHWRSVIAPKGGQGEGQGAARPYTIDAVEVDLFDDEGRLTDVWLFRDPMLHERAALTEGGGASHMIR